MPYVDEQSGGLAEKALDVFAKFRGSSVTLSRQYLCHELNCEDRQLRKAIRELRCEGWLIVADESGGYRFARSPEEVFGYTASLKSRIRALREVVDAMEGEARKVWGEPVQQLGLL